MKSGIFDRLCGLLASGAGRVPYVNVGGCAVAAVEIYRSLVEMGEKPKIYVVGPGYCHVVVKIGRKFLDATGERTTGDLREEYGQYRKIGEADFETVARDAADDWKWNSKFDRRNIPTLHLRIGEAVKLAYARVRT